MSKLPPVFETYKPHIEKEIRSIIHDGELYTISGNGSTTIYNMMAYHLGWSDENGREIKSYGGKYLRATLTLLVCDSIGVNFKCALTAAAAIELIHNFSLVHDDIQDDDETRRHKPTVWKIWGKPQAINVGSAMKTLASLAIHNLQVLDVPAEKIILLLKILDESCLRMIEGQYLDIDFESRSNISIDDYLNMIERKTSSLIECSLQIGAALILDETELIPFKNFGKNLGLAFQVKDDILGIWGSNEKTGKPSGNDIRKKKKSFPVVCAFCSGGDAVKKEFVNTYKKKRLTDDDVERILVILGDLNSKQVSEEKAEFYYRLAIDNLEQLPVKKNSRCNYREILDFLMKRDF